MSEQRVVIVGGGLATLRCVEGLRRGGYDGAITVVGAEPHRCYDRPPLSKEILRGDWDLDRVTLRGDRLDDDAADAELEVDWRRGRRAVSLSLHPDRTVSLDDDTTVTADAVVIATGSDARSLPGVDPALAGVHVLRTLDDAVSLRADLADHDGPVVVIGGGFIGAEVAASAAAIGRQVTILEALPVPLSRVLGDVMGAALAALHADHGVEVRTAVRVDAVDGGADGRVSGVSITDADGSVTTVPAATVVVGIGAVPATGWLDGSGLTIDNGVVCDETLRAADGVWAIGDVARWPNQRFDGEVMRLEHWTNAVESAFHVAPIICRHLAGSTEPPTPFTPLPYVWSDQYEHKILHVGRNRADDEVDVLVGSIEDRRFVAGYQRDGRLVAALALDDPRRFMRFRRLVDAGASWDEAAALADELAG